MSSMNRWIGLGLVILVMAGPATLWAQCSNGLVNLDAPDLEYLGLRTSGQRNWVGQQFATDCDAQFLTVSFLIEIQLFPENGVTNLTLGDTLTCTVMDDQNVPIASVDQVLTRSFGNEWVEFDFAPLELGLAEGTLAVKVATPHDAFCRVATSLDQVPGQLMLGDEDDLNYIGTRDAGFRITWDPGADITGVESRSWGELKALYR